MKILRHYLCQFICSICRRHHFVRLFGVQWCFGPDRFGWKDDTGYAFCWISQELRDRFASVPDWKNN